MNKIFILDTNVLLQSPQAIYAFDDNDVVIPEVVLEELDKFKKESTENGINARQAARMLDELREQGDLTSGVELLNGGSLRIELNFTDITLPEGWLPGKADNRILKVCKGPFFHWPWDCTGSSTIRIKYTAKYFSAVPMLNLMKTSGICPAVRQRSWRLLCAR